MSKINLKVKDLSKFVGFVDKIRQFNNNVSIEIREDEIVSKIVSEGRKAMKLSNLNFSDVFELGDGSLPHNLILNIYNADKFVKLLKAIDGDGVMFDIEYGEANEQNNCYASNVKAYNDQINFIVPCAEDTVMVFYPDDKIYPLFDLEEIVFQCTIDTKFIEKISLFNTTDTNTNFKIKANKKNNVLSIMGVNYDINHNGECVINDNMELKLSKDYIKFLDNEPYDMYGNIHIRKRDNTPIKTIVFIGKESNSKIMLSGAASGE